MYKVLYTEDLPEVLEPTTIYVLRCSGNLNPFSATIACPTGCCDRRITLNLMKPFKPRWVLDETTVTLKPSIDMKTQPCKCHFTIKEGNVVWTTKPSTEWQKSLVS